ncbi:MAG: hypothetical protein JWO52_1258 [Gammaproteobacteria bacterium]|jgi:hypothetical protein|nr:hypothetical protein [Gammaproteobacteria bacterium]
MPSSSGHVRSLLTAVCCLVFTVCFARDLLQAARSEPLQVVESAAQTSPSHIALEQSLAAILSEKSDVFASIDGNDLERLRIQLAQIREQLRLSRLQMDQALLTGAWSQTAEKAAAAQIIGRMQGIEILSLMGVATVSGYDYPTHKVPGSARDSTQKLFGALAELSADVVALNRRAHP